MNREPVAIYTDGSCRGNPGPGGYAAVLKLGSREKEVTGGEPVTTNNRMELMGAISGLEALTKPARVEMHCDSRYVIDGITKWIHGWKKRGWKDVANRDLWERLAAAVAPHQVTWSWVEGHTGDPMNERADKLATAEADRQGEQGEDIRIGVELEARVEVECALAPQKDAANKAPPWCKKGPGNTGVYCLLADKKGKCEHAFLILGESKLVLRDKQGGREKLATGDTGKGPEVDKLKRVLGDLGDRGK